MHLKNLVIGAIGLFLVSARAEAVSLRGSSESLDKQMAMARRLHFPLIKTLADIERMHRHHELFQLPEQGEGFYLDGVCELDKNHCHLYAMARAPVVKFISIIGRDFLNKFGKRLKVTSLTRTLWYQKMLQHRNANAAALSRTAHRTGAAIDISYKEMTMDEMNWMRRRLKRLEEEKMLEATEERFQACFHVMVFRE